MWFGVPNFLQPRWWNPNLGLAAWLPWWTSLYDTSPVRTLIERYVDFDALAASHTRLLLSAVDVATGEPRIFDSYVDRIGPEHLLASGSLPPGMPWTMVEGRPYWDGGIVSNSPLDLVIERCGRIGGRIFAVDLFSGTRAMPSNLLEVMLRRDEIVYTDRVRNDLRFEEYVNDFSDLVDEILKQVDEPTARRIRQRPHFIRLMGNRAPIRIARIALDGGPLSLSSDFDFSASTVARLQTRGYETALAVLEREEMPVAAD
jgi:predicted acylesterase/phospholipase RssA